MGMGVDTTSQVGASVLFFCYDTVKIAILLVAVIFIIGYIQSYFPPERTKKLLGHLHAREGRPPQGERDEVGRDEHVVGPTRGLSLYLRDAREKGAEQEEVEKRHVLGRRSRVGHYRDSRRQRPAFVPSGALCTSAI